VVLLDLLAFEQGHVLLEIYIVCVVSSENVSILDRSRLSSLMLLGLIGISDQRNWCTLSDRLTCSL
jgi:hypothetical protein